MLKNNRKVTSFRHPTYIENITQWKLYRSAYEGGRNFINDYLTKFSRREDDGEFRSRKDSSYCPAHAKISINEIKDAISERLVDVIRLGGPVSYQESIIGKDGGVDGKSSTMNNFISDAIIPELLPMGKVGVYVDRQALPIIASKAEVKKTKPYLYVYGVEDILNWHYDNENNLTAVLLRDQVYKEDEETGLPIYDDFRYRFLQKKDDGIHLDFYDKSGVLKESVILDLEKIPFVIFKLKQALMTDIADYQVALLNLGSSDLSYALKSNFPFYVEQFDPTAFNSFLLRSSDADVAHDGTETDGTSISANTAKDAEVKLGSAQGRRYPKGLERPGYINPSPEPLKVSMLKQEKLQDEIRELVRLSVKGESVTEKDRSVESGLSSIGSIIEQGEREIGLIWSEYTEEEAPIIKYPEDYSLKSDEERSKVAKELEDHVTNTPSITLKKELTKQIARILTGHKVSKETMDKIEQEIDELPVIITDPQEIRDDHEKGLVSTELASQLRGYPKGQVEKAKQDHIERITNIALAQSKASIDTTIQSSGTVNMRDDSVLNSSRGIKDFDVNNQSARDEKELSRNTDEDGIIKDKTRGEGNE